MKRLFYFLFVLCTGVMASAQSPLVATLTHNGNISTFYGATALSQAHEAAVDGFYEKNVKRPLDFGNRQIIGSIDL